MPCHGKYRNEISTQSQKKEFLKIYSKLNRSLIILDKNNFNDLHNLEK